MEFQKILVVGLPETGKSSFIQAVDEVLKHPATDQDLRTCGLAHDRTYIESGKDEYFAGVIPGRTDRNIENTAVELWFENPRTGQKGRLHMPDEKGEVFLDQWVNRHWDNIYRESLPGLSGMLVFVRADGKPRNEERLAEMAVEIVASGVNSAEMETAWHMKEASPQVQLVDILQFISERGEIPKHLRISIIISAWDTVGARPGDIRPKHPEKFLAREWSLLSQYLLSNADVFEAKIFGVSAHGGEPSKLGEIANLPPHQRVTVTDGTTESRDLTRPLRWLLRID